MENLGFKMFVKVVRLKLNEAETSNYMSFGFLGRVNSNFICVLHCWVILFDFIIYIEIDSPVNRSINPSPSDVIYECYHKPKSNIKF